MRDLQSRAHELHEHGLEEDENGIVQDLPMLPLRRSAAAVPVELKSLVSDGVAPSQALVKQSKRKSTSSSSSSEPKAKKQQEGPSKWARFLTSFQQSNPGMSMGESIIEARKRYIGPNGRPKSYEKTWKQVWQHRNPTWKTMGTAEEIKAKMREDFLNKI